MFENWIPYSPDEKPEEDKLFFILLESPGGHHINKLHFPDMPEILRCIIWRDNFCILDIEENINYHHNPKHYKECKIPPYEMHTNITIEAFYEEYNHEEDWPKLRNGSVFIPFPIVAWRYSTTPEKFCPLDLEYYFSEDGSLEND